jgi:hypothetical protein
MFERFTDKARKVVILARGPAGPVRRVGAALLLTGALQGGATLDESEGEDG